VGQTKEREQQERQEEQRKMKGICKMAPEIKMTLMTGAFYRTAHSCGQRAHKGGPG